MKIRSLDEKINEKKKNIENMKNENNVTFKEKTNIEGEINQIITSIKDESNHLEKVLY